MMKIVKDNETITVITDNNQWNARIGQCYTNTLGENVYKLDDDYILFEYCKHYGLMKIIERGKVT